MSEKIILTIKFQDKNLGLQMKDLELPSDVSIQILAPLLMDALGWQVPKADKSQKVEYHFAVDDANITVQSKDTFQSKDVLTGDILTLYAELVALDDGQHKELLSGIYLASRDAKHVFHLQRKVNRIGRRDSVKGIPDIDLTAIDLDKISHREHAQIFWQNGEYTLAVLPDGAKGNGLFVNGQEIKMNERVRLTNGDKLVFGQGGVELIFHHNSKTN